MSSSLLALFSSSSSFNSEENCPGLFLFQAAIARQLLYRDLSETAFASGSRFSLIRCDTASRLWNPADCETKPRVKSCPGIFESRAPLYVLASYLSTKPQDITPIIHSQHSPCLALGIVSRASSPMETRVAANGFMKRREPVCNSNDKKPAIELTFNQSYQAIGTKALRLPSRRPRS